MACEYEQSLIKSLYWMEDVNRNWMGYWYQWAQGLRHSSQIN